jgi:hypothetical protein
MLNYLDRPLEADGFRHPVIDNSDLEKGHP